MSQQVITLTLKENLTAANSAKFKQDIADILTSDKEIIVIDCQNVTFLDSSGLGSLVLAFKTLKEADKKMVLRSVNEQVNILLELTGMDEKFTIVATQDDIENLLLTTN